MAFTYSWANLNEIAKANVRNIPTTTLDARHCDLVSQKMASILPWRPLISTIGAGTLPLVDGAQDYSVPSNFVGLTKDVRLTRTDATPDEDINLTVVDTIASDLSPVSPYTIRSISHEMGIGQLRLSSAVTIASGTTWEIRGQIRTNPTKISATTQDCWFDDKYASVAIAGLEYWVRKLAGDANAGGAATDNKGRMNYTGQLGVFYAMLRDMQSAEDGTNGALEMFPDTPLAVGRNGGDGIWP